MAKMPFIINGTDHPRKIATETITKIGDDILASAHITTVPVKWRLASEATVEEIIGTTIREAASSAMIIETHQAPADKIINQGSRGRTRYHPKIF
jgi:hypothetical protein